MANINRTKVVTGVNTRLSYFHGWEPVSINGGAEKYSVSVLIPKDDTETVNAINKAIDAANNLAADDWTPETWEKVVEALGEANNVPKNLTIDDQDKINAATEALNNAITSLESSVLKLVAAEGSTTVIDDERGFIYGLKDGYLDTITDLVAQG